MLTHRVRTRLHVYKCACIICGAHDRPTPLLAQPPPPPPSPLSCEAHETCARARAFCSHEHTSTRARACTRVHSEINTHVLESITSIINTHMQAGWAGWQAHTRIHKTYAYIKLSAQTSHHETFEHAHALRRTHSYTQTQHKQARSMRGYWSGPGMMPLNARECMFL